MDEAIFSSPAATVTKTRLLVGNQCFPVKNITSFRIERFAPTRWSILAYVAAGLTGMVALAKGDPGSGTAAMVWWAIGFALSFFEATKFFVVLNTAGSEQKCLTTHDEEIAQGVITALNRAVSE